MSTGQCRRLREALAWARQRPTKVIVLMGGSRLLVERHPPQHHRGGGDSPGRRVLGNINAIDDLAANIETGTS
jgi:putative two-component system hydrogenase maturation factor HypX/HoxX